MIFTLSASVWEKILQLDQWLFIQLNSKFTNPVFDAILPYFRDSVFWAPFYLFILAFVGLNFGKKGILWSLGFLCTLAITDLCGTYLFKQNFQRIRPCGDPVFLTHVRLLVKQCSGGYSFISNHAANHFGLATFMVLTFRHITGKWIYLLFVWAFLIAYAQIYVGVHYPTDVLGGAVVGSAAAWMVAWLYHKYFGDVALINHK